MERVQPPRCETGTGIADPQLLLLGIFIPCLMSIILLILVSSGFVYKRQTMREEAYIYFTSFTLIRRGNVSSNQTSVTTMWLRCHSDCLLIVSFAC
jgi:hypothetical protein